MKYEWKDGQLWDNDRRCWVIWATCSGAVGMTEEMKANIARLLNAEDQDLGKELAGARKELAKYMRLAEDRAREIDDLRQSLRMELRKVGS